MSGILWALSLRALILTYPHLSMSTDKVFPLDRHPEATLNIHHLRHTKLLSQFLQYENFKWCSLSSLLSMEDWLWSGHSSPPAILTFFFLAHYASSWIHPECKFRWDCWHWKDDQGKSFVAHGWTHTWIDFGFIFMQIFSGLSFKP